MWPSQIAIGAGGGRKLKSHLEWPNVDKRRTLFKPSAACMLIIVNLRLTAKASITRLASVQWKLLLSVIERKRRKSKEVAHIRQTINEPAAIIIISGLEQQ